MKRLLIFCLCCLGLASCKNIVWDYDPGYSLDTDSFFKTQWYAREHNGQSLRYNEDIIIFDFDLYKSRHLTIYATEGRTISSAIFSAESYEVERVSEVTWAIRDYRYKGVLHDVVIVRGGVNYAELFIYNRSDELVDSFQIGRNQGDDIVDLSTFE